MNRLEFLNLANQIIVDDDRKKAIETICEYIKNEEYPFLMGLFFIFKLCMLIILQNQEFYLTI